MKKLFLSLLISVMLIASVSVALAKPAGYNWKALVFVGTGMQYCEQRLGITDVATCEAAIGEDADDHLVMKWSQAWQDAVFGPDGDRNTGDELDWTTDAWVSNHWNGSRQHRLDNTAHGFTQTTGRINAQNDRLR